MNRYRKALVAVAGVLAAVCLVLEDGSVDAKEWGVLAGAVAVALGVERVPNEQAEAGTGGNPGP